MGGVGVLFTVTQEEELEDNSPRDLNNYSIPLLQLLEEEKEQDSLLEVEKALSFHLEEEGCSRLFLVNLEVSLCQEESINSLLEAPSALREEGPTISQVVQTSILQTGQTNTLQRQEDSSILQAE